MTETMLPKVDAVLLGRADSGSPEWHELRSKGIGGSEVAAICGLSKWESAYSLWAKKTGRVERDVIASEAMEWGNRAEPMILDKFSEVHPDLTVYGQPGTYAKADAEWMIANPDAFVVDETGKVGIVEVKTAQYEDDWRDGVPQYYQTQVQHYLDVLGVSFAYVAVLFHGNRYREYEVAASEFAQGWQRERIEAFYACVVDDVAPKFDGADSTYKTVRELNPLIEDDGVELGYLGEQYFTAAKEFEAAEQQLNLMKSYIIDAMGTAKRGLVNDVWTFTRQARGTGTPYLITKKG